MDASRDQGPGTRNPGAAKAPAPAEGSGTGTLDAAIDLVAREMTSAEAPAWLRAKVLEQIASAPAARRLAFPAWAWMSAAAILVLAVAGAMWVSGPQQVGEPAGTTASARPAGAPPADSSAGVPEATPGPMAVVEEPPTENAIVAVRRQPVQAAAEPEAESAMLVEWRKLAPDEVTIEPISMTSLRPPAVDIEEIALDPLDGPEPLTIPSLDPGSTEQRSTEPARR